MGLEFTEIPKVEQEFDIANILEEGPFNPSKISIRHTQQTIKHSSELDVYIESYWQEYLKEHPTAFNGPSILLVSHQQSDGFLNLETGLTSFKERVATQKPEIAKKFGMEAIAVTLGVCLLPVTADNKIVLVQRLTYHPRKKGGLHTIGGMIEQKKDIINGKPDINHALARETEEESGIKQGEFQVEKCLGLMQSRETLSCDLLFIISTRLTEKDIRERTGDQEVALKFIPNTPDAVRNIMLRNLKTASSPSLALLYLYGQDAFGKGWAAFARARSSRRRTVYNEFSPELSEKAGARLEKLLRDQ